jgi:hypothetical protein
MVRRATRRWLVLVRPTGWSGAEPREAERASDPASS